jgi:CheY-like chemotaxis protein
MAMVANSVEDITGSAETVFDSGPIDILIADDEPFVRRLLEVALRPSGLRVESVGDGAQAARRFLRHQGDVRLVVLDVQMPDVDGVATLRMLREINPDVRVVFMTGDPGRYSVDELLGQGAIGMIDKPFGNLLEIAGRLKNLAGAAPALAR